MDMQRVLLQFWVPNYDERLLDSIVSQYIRDWSASARGQYALRVGIEPYWRSSLVNSQQRIQILAGMSDAQYTAYQLC